MAATAKMLAPIFRSEQQMRLLAEVFFGEAGSGADLARRLGIAQQTVARELSRLESAGLIAMRQIGTAKLPEPRRDAPIHDALRQLLGYVGGIIPELMRLFESRAEIEEVFIFGSWARRFRGEQGPPPNDIDVAIVSDSLSLFDLAAERLELEASAGATIDLFVLPTNHDRLAELRDGSVAVLRRTP